jgi:heme a synthase
MSRSSWLHRYSKLVTVCTIVLIAAGGTVTSTGSGLSVPDWPTSYGWNMFTFPVRNWVGGIKYEHVHRLIASTVGFLTIALAWWTWRSERGAVRWLGPAALGTVILQGVLGGLTVLFFLPAPISTGHAGLAQIFFCLTLTLALLTSPGWKNARDWVDDDRLRRLAATTTTLVYVQILLGATMRHTGAGLAIPDFPFAFGGIVPDHWSPAIGIHFGHRVFALVVTASVVATVARAWTHGARPEIRRPALLLGLLVTLQIALGASVVLSALDPVINTMHVVNGALVLGTSLVLTLRSFRPVFERRAAAIRARHVAPSAAPLGARS